MTNTKAQTAKHTPGFRVEEIYRAFDGGDRVAAVKMLRAETGCGLKEAIDALNGRCIETLPSFEEAARRKRIERAAPELLAALKIVCEASQLAVSALDSDDPGADSMMQKFWRSLEPARAAIARATGDA